MLLRNIKISFCFRIFFSFTLFGINPSHDPVKIYYRKKGFSEGFSFHFSISHHYKNILCLYVNTQIMVKLNRNTIIIY